MMHGESKGMIYSNYQTPPQEQSQKNKNQIQKNILWLKINNFLFSSTDFSPLPYLVYSQRKTHEESTWFILQIWSCLCSRHRIRSNLWLEVNQFKRAI